MNKVQIMIVGNTTNDAARIADQLNPQASWNITAASDTEDAISLFQQYDYDMVLFSGELPEAEVKKMSSLFRFQYEDVSLATIGDKGAQATLEESFQKRKRMHRPVYAFADDALKEAVFNINLS
ncbi:MAG: hypothetical protein EOP49_25915 [Sphingobacteriales bacterium]|nr:MAG: hypothetical protein EOP49_25915 [Sphingobacteriales bacterium]